MGESPATSVPSMPRQKQGQRSGSPIGILRVSPLTGLNRGNFARELLAGVSLIALAVPLNVGYAQIAGLPATAGLYALVVPTIVYVLFVSSRQLVASPDAAASALVFSSLVALGAGTEDLPSLAMAQAILGGVILLVAGLLRLGFLAQFLSHPILVGFVSGLAIEILLSQVAKMLGVKLEAEGFFAELAELVTVLGQSNPWSVGIAASALVVLIAGRRLAPAVPWALIVIVAATLASSVLSLEARGVSVLGEVQSGLPSFSVPMLPFRTWLSLVPSALALALVAMAEGLLLSRNYAQQHGYPVDPDKDLVAMGLANVAAGFGSSYSMGASGSRTAAMDDAGSRTQLPSLVLAVGAVLLLAFGTGLLAPIPSPAIGAIVGVAVWRLVGVGQYRHLRRESTAEMGVAVACALGVLVVGPIGGLLLAFVLSLINLVRRAADPPIDILVGPGDPTVALTRSAAPGAETAPGIIIIRFAAPLFFANAQRLLGKTQDAVLSIPQPPRYVGLDLEGVTDIDVTGAAALRVLRAWLADRHITLFYTRVREDLLDRLDHFALRDEVVCYPTNGLALAALGDAETDRGRPDPS